jgi:hypothetical protein
MAFLKNPIVKWATGFAAKLRFPYLFLLTGSLFLLDLVFPDFIPFADELLLGLGTLLFANLRKRKTDAKHPDSMSDAQRRT